jgi:hypothetical protein
MEHTQEYLITSRTLLNKINLNSRSWTQYSSYFNLLTECVPHQKCSYVLENDNFSNTVQSIIAVFQGTSCTYRETNTLPAAANSLHAIKRFRDFSILFPKGFQNSFWKKERKRKVTSTSYSATAASALKILLFCYYKLQTNKQKVITGWKNTRRDAL